MGACRVLVVDDDPLFLLIVTHYLSLDPQVMLVGQLGSGRAAVQHFVQLQPDVVVLDVQLPELNGFETTVQLRAQPDAPQVVLMTAARVTPADRAQAAAVGAAALLEKQDVVRQLLPVMHALSDPRLSPT